MAKVYMYVVARDLGFAPNPFHGYCTLATCKPKIRNVATTGDWVIGFGGSTLKATGKCIFAMRVTQKLTFNQYWNDPVFNDKKPVQNGSQQMLVGDNIYHQNHNNIWEQSYSHHSYEDGSTNKYNLNRDTGSDKVLISEHFYYFGNSAPLVPNHLLSEIGYKNKIGHRTFPLDEVSCMIHWLEKHYSQSLNRVDADPYDFDKSHSHYSVETNKINT
ncbi:Nmad2 family putative nucleotide modification protein [Spirosoma rhododendri]|uniref:Nucleotide modification associated domain-containing protein n=1 Tax=Spirosoma rhododendri TaxID=2728024 RepID=A0A7L5DYT5_9BACT|nr:hypothetical protein [Spirosoma rhododendri]QJD81147.1 hypothetical protein HH216_24015 [Spirosoma rhododendri]